jgi:hypothetical protein
VNTNSPRPYKVDREGVVTERATGKDIGFVRLDSNKGWTGYLTGPEYPNDPWQQHEVTTRHWNGRKYAAQAVWNEYQQQKDPAEEGAT